MLLKHLSLNEMAFLVSMCSIDRKIMASSNSVKFDAGNLPTSHVTVFSDRAEVCKTIKCHVNKGVNEILVEKLSNSIDSNSIRVEGFGANASIAEVKYSEKPAMRVN